MTERTTLENVADVYPLSPMQLGMVFHSIADPHSGVFVNQITTELRGELDVAAFKASWAALLDRHAVLRTAFLWDGLDEPLQVVRERVELAWAMFDWASISSDEQAARLDAVLREDRTRGFDLADAPLMRMMLIRTGSLSWRWVWSLHHVVSDGWSAQVLLNELFALYRSRIRGERLILKSTFAYRDFISEQLARDEAREERFWRERLAGFDSPHGLEVPGLPPESGAVGYRDHTVELDAATLEALRAAAAGQSVTLNTAVVGAWALLLSRWTRERDVVFGVTMAGRDSDLPGIEHAVGLFINTLPLRVGVEPERRLGEWLRDLQKAQIETREFQQSSLASVQRWSEVAAGQALFESIFVFENYPDSGRRDTGGVDVGAMRFIEQSNYPLAVLVVPGDSLSITLVHDTAQLSSQAVERLGARLTTLLGKIAQMAESPLSAIDVLTSDDREQLKVLDAGPEAPIDERCMHEIIEDVARQRPDDPAVVFEGSSITYGDLDELADGIADRLRAAGVTANRPVGLYLPRSVEMITGMLGILKAGGAYLPLDPAYPASHIRSLLEGDAIDIVLTRSGMRGDLPDSVAVVAIDDPAPESLVDAPAPVSNDDLAYVIHTSGSTGRPKGVMVTHRNLVQSTLARNVHYGDPVGRFLLLSSFSFDSSVAGIFWTLGTGGTLVLPAPKLEHDVDQLVALARDHQVTHLLCLPAMYRLLLEHALDGEMSSLKVAIVAGEACPPGVLELHNERLPGAELHNEYGPTEATVWCTAHRATAADLGRALPIGRPIANTRVRLLDDHDHRVPPGFAGELCVAGPGVTTGYLNRPDLTAERFTTVRIDGSDERLYRTGDLACFLEDGTLTFLGRVDRQLKIRGHRIETGAVEAALRAHPLVRECAVVGRRAEGRAVVQLVGYVVADAFDASQLQADLRGTLPAFMVPDVLAPLDDLPRLPNGKVDYQALPDPTPLDTSARPAPPRNEIEATLAAIWSDLLGREEIGIRDDFFAAGGDSIVSIQMISRARQAGIRIEPGQITTYPTIEGLAAASSIATTGRADDGPVTGPVPLGPVQQWFFEAELAVPSHWNQSGLFELPAHVDGGALEIALQACLDHHDMLRARFVQADGRWHQVVDADRRVAFDVLDVTEDEVDFRVAAAQSALDLERGPVMAAVLLRISGTGRRLLLLAIHHLVIDAVSWSIFAEDLETAYAQAIGGAAVEFPPRTTSFRDWINRLAGEDRSAERPYWVRPATTPEMPKDRPSRDAGTEETRRVVRTELEGEATAQLLADVHDAYKTTSEELLVAALAAAAAEWLGSRTVRMALEGHGRPTDAEGVDLSRTVGWFTAYYPVTLELGPKAKEGELVRAVKEQMRAVPRGGIGYGALRYLDRDETVVRQASPEIVFNYLSRVRDFGSHLLTPVSGVEESSRDGRNARSHMLEVVAAVQHGRLTVDWYYSSAVHDATTIESVAGAFMTNLRNIIDHCLSDGAGGFTPSDFPEAGLDQAELDRFLDGIV